MAVLQTLTTTCSAHIPAGLGPRKQFLAFKSVNVTRSASRSLYKILKASSDTEASTMPSGSELENPDSEASRKKAAADELRLQEKFMMIGTGEAQCTGCGYVYEPKKGDPEYPISAGIRFEELPEDWQCPVCGVEKKMFNSLTREVAGFAANQGYGLGTNSMTSGQKSLLIFGSLALFFVLFLLGYTLE